MNRQISIYIPHFKRKNNINEILKYYKNYYYEQNLIICDGNYEQSVSDISAIGKSRYFHLPNKSPIERIKFALTKVDTPYFALSADDNFLYPPSIKKIINFLENNLEYDCGYGKTFNIYRGISIKHKLKNLNYNSFDNSYIQNFNDYLYNKNITFNNYIFRSNYLINVIKELLNLDFNNFALIQENYLTFKTLKLKKTKYLDCEFSIRTQGNTKVNNQIIYFPTYKILSNSIKKMIELLDIENKSILKLLYTKIFIKKNRKLVNFILFIFLDYKLIDFEYIYNINKKKIKRKIYRIFLKKKKNEANTSNTSNNFASIDELKKILP